MDKAELYRIRTLRSKIKSITVERSILLKEQRALRIELDEYKEKVKQSEE